MTGTHEDDTAIPVKPGSKRARVSTDTKATPEKKDLLTELFEKMRPYCNFTVVHNDPPEYLDYLQTGTDLGNSRVISYAELDKELTPR